MKIGLALDDSLDRPDGVQQYVLTIGEWLTHAGHEVHYIASTTSRNDVANMHSVAKNIQVRFNHNVLRIPLPLRSAQAKTILQQLNLDVLHVQMPYSPLFVGRLIAAAPEHLALVSTFHILPAHWLAQTGARALATLQRRSLNRLDQTLAVSKPAAEFAAKAFGLQTAVVPNAVTISNFQHVHDDVYPKHSTAIDIRYLGRLVRRKGVKELLSAFAKLVRMGGPEVHLTIGGRGELLEELRAKVDRDNLQEHVTFAGFIDERNKPSFLAHADITVFPALGGESFGIVLLEAMAAGSGVVLAGDNAGYRSVMDDDSYMLRSTTNAAIFAEQLDSLIEDVVLRQTMHQLQNKLVKQYDVEVIGQKLQTVYQETIAKRRSNSHNIT
jgi:phosphatidyl-myo-inositol alpha-mannosyltransferase